MEITFLDIYKRGQSFEVRHKVSLAVRTTLESAKCLARCELPQLQWRLNNVGSNGNYWSSTPGGSENAWYLGFGSGRVGMYYPDRCGGQSVRLVQNK